MGFMSLVFDGSVLELLSGSCTGGGTSPGECVSVLGVACLQSEQRTIEILECVRVSLYVATCPPHTRKCYID